MSSKGSCQYSPNREHADLIILEKFVTNMYNTLYKHSSTCKVDKAILRLFAFMQRSYDATQLTSAFLLQHVKHCLSNYLHILSGNSVCKMQNESPADWDWQNGGIWHVLWKTLPPIDESCERLTKCDARLTQNVMQMLLF